MSSHGNSHGNYDRQNPNLPLVTFFGVGILVATVLSAVILRGWFEVTVQQEVHQKVGAYPTTQWDDLKKQAQAKLNAPAGVTDPATGVGHIPIARAMELTVKEIKEGKTAQAAAPTGPTGKTGTTGSKK
ncbi:MAG: hypothetical protein IT381_26480 [Deltaproteobacteria bacterium]|nr:hypothetical protein [Deltaproteobacteria bacterium]